MRLSRLKALTASLFAATVGLEIVAVVLSWGLEPRYDTVLYAVYTVAQAGAGALIASRHPSNPIGWLFSGFAVVNAVTADAAQGWGLRAAEAGWVGGPIGEWIATTNWVLGGIGLVLIFILFPDGRLPGRRWRYVVWVGLLGAALALPGWTLNPDIGGEFISGQNPLAVEALRTDLLLLAGIALLSAALVASVTSLVLRLRRSHGIERLQLKWFAFAASCAAVILPIAGLLWTSVPVVRPLAAIALTALPIAAGIGILRYRLYDIDLVINRTLVYGSVTAVLAAAYFASALILGVAVGRGSAWATAGATLAVAIAFRPLRDRVQDGVDQRFSRDRYAALQSMTTFLDDLRAGRAAPDEVQRVLRAALRDESIEVHFFLPASEFYVDSHGGPVAVARVVERDEFPIRRSGVLLGRVVRDRAPDADRALLVQLVDTGGLAIEIARLQVELRRQLTEVAASRTRIVAAADEERRRMERDLHDGAQQRLVSIGLALRHAQHRLGPAVASDVGRTLDGAVAEITVAIDELRELARGLPPAHLDAGLGPALRELAGRAPMPVKVNATSARFARDVETAAYFIACEGLTNAVKHAHAAEVALSVVRRNGNVVVCVSDDGIGGAAPRNGSGLNGLSDRVVAQGGTFRIDSLVGRGTRLTAELPCG